MSIGARIGPRVGARIGPRIGSPAASAAVPQTTLTVTIDDDVDPTMTLAPVAFSVIVTNTGGNDASSVTCIVVLGSGMTFGSGSGVGWTVGEAAGTVTCTRALLAPGAAPTLTINVTTGAASVTASTTANVSAANAPAAPQDTETTDVQFVAKDATSGVRLPATLAQLQTVFTLAGTGVTLVQANTWIWTCDEASGNLVDEVNGLAIAPNAAPAYQQAVSGWTAVAVKTTDATANQRFSTTDASIPDILTEAGSFLTYVKFDTVGGVRSIGSLGVTMTEMRNTGVSPRMVCGVTTTSGAATIGTTVARPYWIQTDPAGTTQEFVTDQEKVTGVYDVTVTGKTFRMGAAGATPATANHLYALMLKNTVLSTAQRKAVLQKLGWTIPWS